MIERHRSVGRFELVFRGLPQDIIDRIDELGHIVITVAPEDPPLGDHLLKSARYTGVVLIRRKWSGEYDYLIRGGGLEWWLGTADNTGPVLEEPVSFSEAAFDDAIRALLPDAIKEGNLDPTGLPTYTGTHRLVTRRDAINYICDTVGAEWRVNPDGTLDAGPHASVFGPDPQTVIVRRVQDAGDDMDLRAYPGPAQTDHDVEDYTTRVVVLGRVEGDAVVEGAAELDPGDIPYRDLFGNTVSMTRLVAESATESQNAAARAQAALDQYSQPMRAVRLTSTDYDLRDTVQAGAYVWVYDPIAGMEDPANEITFRGQRINPRLEQVTSVDWPVTEHMGVYYRSPAGEWLDLSRWVDPIDGQTTIDVGRFDRDLIPGASAPTGFTPSEPDTSVPNPPTFVTPFTTSAYQGGDGQTRAQVVVEWVKPAANTDNTEFTDGNHFEIRYRIAPFAAGTWGQAAVYTWGELGTWGLPLPQPGSGEWEMRFAPIDATTALVGGLAPSTRYEFQIRVLDSATPPNASVWSESVFIYTADDNTPPATPAEPIVAGALTQISVKHLLGTDQGGTFNLDLDLAYLEVHASTEGAGFTPDESDVSTTRLGKIEATRAQITGQIPVLGSFPVATTDELWVKVIAVDRAGNRSGPSAAAAVTAELIPSQWVSDLTADKITAGTFTASYAVAGLFRAGDVNGARAEMGDDGTHVGFMARRDDNTLAWHVDAATGDMRLFDVDGVTPTLQFTADEGLVEVRGRLVAGHSFTSGERLVLDPEYVNPGAPGIGELPTLLFYSALGEIGPGRANAFDHSTGDGLMHTGVGFNSGPDRPGASFKQSTLVLRTDRVVLFRTDQSASNPQGGVLRLEDGDALLGVQRPADSVDTYIWIGDDHITFNNTGALRLEGYFPWEANPDLAVFTAFTEVPVSVDTVVLQYGATMAEARVVTATWQGAQNHVWISAISATQVTITADRAPTGPNEWIHMTSLATNL